MKVVPAFALGAAIALLAATLPAPPATPKIPVPDPLFGAHAIDPYRWLEDDDAPRVRAWARAQTGYAETSLHAQPSYAGFRRRVAQLARTSTARFALQIAGRQLVYERGTPPQAQAALVTRDGTGGVERTLFDPVAAAHGGVPVAVDSIFPSPRGDFVAFTTQRGGSEDETLHVVRVATGTLAPDTIAHVGGGVSSVALAWDADGRGFTYTHLPRTGPLALRRFNNELFHHRLGADPARDPYVFGRGQSKVAEYILLSSADGTRTAALVEPGDLGDYAVYERVGTGSFRAVASVADHVREAAYFGNALLLKTSVRHGTFDVLAAGPRDTFSTARTFVAAGPLPIEGLDVAAGSLFAIESDGGESVVHRFDFRGRDRGIVPLPAHIDVAGVAGDPVHGPAVIVYAGYATPGTWVAYDASTGRIGPVIAQTRVPGDYSHLVVKRVLVASADGTVRIPLTTVRLATTNLDGRAPTLLGAYGGYGFIEAPSFVGTSLAWLERGGVLAFAGVRGGGEYGESWHLAAVRATKTRSSDDLASCARWLETHGYGTVPHLGIEGGSDGGFLMGLAITRDPQVYGAVVGLVGIYDIPAWQRSPNGASNIPEFGDARISTDFAYIRKQSPYQNVRDGVAYPAMLMMTGENDPRVSPLNSRKMTARLQAASSSHEPVLLIQQSGAGHGIGASFDQRVTQTTDVLTFLWSRLTR